MRRLSVISFTENGSRLAEKLKERIPSYEVVCFPKEQIKEQGLGAWTGEQMQKKNALLFIGACGIAVRAIAPHLTDKLHDSPVLVMDEQGNYVIPILSGHVGGANELARLIGVQTGAIPVITTATDVNRKFAVDLFAKKNGLWIQNKEGIAKVSEKVLQNQTITMSVETGHVLPGGQIPAGVELVSYPPKQEVDVLITSEKIEAEALLSLIPKEYVLGIGCKKGKEEEKIAAFIDKTMGKQNLVMTQICALASIDHKSTEKGLVNWSQKAGVPFLTFSAEELEQVEGEFVESEFVRQTVGVANVCERSALRACPDGGTLVSRKEAKDGMTLAVARREWRISFDEI